MGSFTQLAYHVVFGTKYRKPTIGDRRFAATGSFWDSILRAAPAATGGHRFAVKTL